VLLPEKWSEWRHGRAKATIESSRAAIHAPRLKASATPWDTEILDRNPLGVALR
jgi:hypothetical protein